MQPKPQHRFLTLDALRGIAAIAVVIGHTAQLFRTSLFMHAYLAVDFFFMLSGFVLTFAYQHKLSQGWKTSSFFKARIARLYPLYAAGLLFGFLLQAVAGSLGKAHSLGLQDLLLFALGVFFLPALSMRDAGSHRLYPYNHPTWSLFYELVINFFHAAVLRRATPRMLWPVVIVAGSVLVYLVGREKTVNFGYTSAEIAFGLARVSFAYVLGMLLLGIWETSKKRVYLSPVLSGLILLLVLAVRVPKSMVSLYDLTTVLVVFPVLLFASASAVPPAPLEKLFEVLGAVSYAIYVIHIPFVGFFGSIWVHFRRRPIEADAPWVGMVLLCCLVTTALLLDRFYDAGARTYLRKMLADPK